MHQQNGSIVICLLTLLAVIMPLCFVVITMSAVLSLDQQMKKICRDQLIQAEQASSLTLEALFKLNPSAKLLRSQKQQTERRLAVAMASANKPLIAQLLLELKRIHAQRVTLDQVQKHFLQKQTFSNQTAVQLVQIRLKKFLQQNIRDIFFRQNIQVIKTKSVGLAVRPDFSDIAPVYETMPNFEEKQTLSVSWKWGLQAVQPSLQKYRLNFSRECSVTLTKRMMKWNPLLKTDKFLLKD